MSDANHSSRFRGSQSARVFGKRLGENDLVRKARIVFTVAAMILAGGAAVVFAGTVIIFLIVPAVIVLCPLFLFLSILPVLYQKVISMLWQLPRPGRDTSSIRRSLVVEDGLWTVISEQHE